MKPSGDVKSSSVFGCDLKTRGWPSGQRRPVRAAAQPSGRRSGAGCSWTLGRCQTRGVQFLPDHTAFFTPELTGAFRVEQFHGRLCTAAGMPSVSNSRDSATWHRLSTQNQGPRLHQRCPGLSGGQGPLWPEEASWNAAIQDERKRLSR